MFISRRGKRWYNPTALNKSKGTPTCIKFETDYFQYIRSMAIRIWLHFVILVSVFALHCFSAAFIMIMRWTWWWNFDLLLPLDTWWKQTRVDLPAAGRTQNTNSWKKRALRRRDSVNEFINFRWIQEGEQMFSGFVWGYPPRYRKSLCCP